MIIRCSWPGLIARLGGRFIDRNRKGIYCVRANDMVVHCPNTGDVWAWRIIGEDER